MKGKQHLLGMFYDRNINGMWVMGEGAVYRDFNAKMHYISREELQKVNFVKYIVGVDWGYEHFWGNCAAGKG